MGTWATITNVPFEKFGEGSFDKGFFFRIPLDWSSAQLTKTKPHIEFNVMGRDGGQKLNVPYRLYNLTRFSHSEAIYKEAGRFWKY